VAALGTQKIDTAKGWPPLIGFGGTAGGRPRNLAGSTPPKKSKMDHGRFKNRKCPPQNKKCQSRSPFQSQEKQFCVGKPSPTPLQALVFFLRVTPPPPPQNPPFFWTVPPIFGQPGKRWPTKPGIYKRIFSPPRAPWILLTGGPSGSPVTKFSPPPPKKNKGPVLSETSFLTSKRSPLVHRPHPRPPGALGLPPSKSCSPKKLLPKRGPPMVFFSQKCHNQNPSPNPVKDPKMAPASKRPRKTIHSEMQEKTNLTKEDSPPPPIP